ncbi:MAG: agglutinin biogenesis protein MshI [Betaproteobacteria bacterium]|nr:MAG: agglutinin biogenesis protein MshI [Betaproteobacteria bacterium]
MKRKQAGRRGAVAVCFQNGRVDVARVQRNHDAQPVLDLWASLPREDTDAETLARLRRDYHLARVPCVTLMPVLDYQLQLMQAPAVPEAELRSAVRWRLKDALEYSPDAATVDVISVPGDPNAPTRGRFVYAVAARNEVIAKRIAMFSEAKLSLKAIDIPEMAQRNIAAMYETPQRALAMLHLTPERGLLTFTAGGELYLVRSIDVGLAQLQNGGGDLRNQLLERVVLEVQRSLDHFDRQFSYLPVSKLVLAPLPEDIGLHGQLSESLSVEIEEVRLESCMDISQLPELAASVMQSQQFLTIGAALREEMSV